MTLTYQHMNATFRRFEAAVTIDLDEHQWDAIGYHGTPNEDPRIRLMGPPLCINGTLLHVMAYQVVEREGVQEPAAEVLRKDYELMQKLYEGAYETVTINGRQYVLHIHPYAI